MQLAINIPDSMLDEALALGLPPQELVEELLKTRQLENTCAPADSLRPTENRQAKKFVKAQ